MADGGGGVEQCATKERWELYICKRVSAAIYGAAQQPLYACVSLTHTNVHPCRSCMSPCNMSVTTRVQIAALHARANSLGVRCSIITIIDNNNNSSSNNNNLSVIINIIGQCVKCSMCSAAEDWFSGRQPGVVMQRCWTSWYLFLLR